MKPGFSDEEFVGYTFQGSPERRSRLWFLDRHIAWLVLQCGWTVSQPEATWSGEIDIDVGTWSSEVPDRHREKAQMVGERFQAMSPQDRDRALAMVPHGTMDRTFPGILLRYNHHGREPWSAVWLLTDVTIPHVHTFGRDDDVWRLGVWPD